MIKVLFDSIDDMVGEIQEGDNRSAFIVKYRGKDFFALAVDEASAMAEVAKELKMEVGLIPLDLIVGASMRRAIKGANATVNGAAAPKQQAADSLGIAKPLDQMKVGEVRDVAKALGIAIEGKSRESLEAEIFAIRPDFKPAAAAETK